MLTRWPLPALLSWAAAWAAFTLLRPVDGVLALAAAALIGAGLALLHARRWRRLIVALGFPLALLLSGQSAGLPAWVWLLPLALLAWAYPRRTWGDAPLFPTPAGALLQLAELAPLPPAARLLDAGCGLGHGLRELHRAYPSARVQGIEWSGLLALFAHWRCPWAQIERGDMWAQSWQGFDLVYVFQRPETMARVWAKACAELEEGAHLVSLDFEVPDQAALHSLDLPRGHSLRIYKPVKAAQMQRSGNGAAMHTQETPALADMG